LIDNADSEVKDGLETLMAGGTVSAAADEYTTYGEIYKKAENLWNFLLFTGYLKKVGESVDRLGRIILEMKIPNRELNIIFETQIKEWFRDKIAEKNLDALYNAVTSGDVETFQNELSDILSESISYMDNAESFYHGVMVGALARINGYRLRSNRESGDGRSDISTPLNDRLVLYSANHKDNTAVIFEFKAVKEFAELSTACENALKQIEDKNYTADWIKDGYKNIIKYGIGFYGKRCKIKMGK